MLSSLYILSFIYLFLYFLPIECQVTCFKKSSYIFSKWERVWDKNRHICSGQGGDLVSIETEEEWQFINREIQKRATWITGALHIGLEKKGGVWTWLSGEQLNISKWQVSESDANEKRAEISKNGGLFNSISRYDKTKSICEMRGGKITL